MTVTRHKAALARPAGRTRQRRMAGANHFLDAKHYAASMSVPQAAETPIAKCDARAVAKRDAAGTRKKCRALRRIAGRRPTRSAGADVPGGPAGARRMRGTAEPDGVQHALRNRGARATPRRSRRRSEPTSAATGAGAPAGDQTQVNVGATRVGNLFARVQLHLATSRFLAELRADALWQAACDDSARALDSLASGMTPAALATPLHARSTAGHRRDADRASRTAPQASAYTVDARLRRERGTTRISPPVAYGCSAITARHTDMVVTSDRAAPTEGEPASARQDAPGHGPYSAARQPASRHSLRHHQGNRRRGNHDQGNHHRRCPHQGIRDHGARGEGARGEGAR